MLSAIFLSLFALQSQAPASEGQPDRLPCTTCAGEGVVLRKCLRCTGRGTSSCIGCKGSLPKEMIERRAHHFLAVDPFEAVRQHQAYAIIRDSIAAMNPMEVPPGKVDCPSCREGHPFLFPKVKCPVCKGKGMLKCKTCNGRRKAKCPDCGGKRKIHLVCSECRGLKTVPSWNDPAADALKCPWCIGNTLVDCIACPDDGLVERMCPPCLGKGRRVCTKCAGARKVDCDRCQGTARLIRLFGDEPGPCPNCDEKGLEPCEACDKGIIHCEDCDGSGRNRVSCLSCFGFKKMACSGCWNNSEHAWVVTAERLFAEGIREAALAHMEVALGRVHLRHRMELSSAAGDKKWTKMVNKRYEKLIQNLERRQTEMEAEEPAPEGG